MCRLDFMGTSYSTPKMMPLGKCFGGTCQAQCIEWFSSKLHTSNAQGISSCHRLLYNLSRLGVDYLPGVPVTPPPKKKSSTFKPFHSSPKCENLCVAWKWEQRVLVVRGRSPQPSVPQALIPGTKHLLPSYWELPGVSKASSTDQFLGLSTEAGMLLAVPRVTSSC